MAWRTSDRRTRLPHNWPAIRAQVRRRAGGRCEWALPDGTRCPTPGTDCDHRDRGDDHSLANLQWLCTPHHQVKTNQENQDALAERRALRPRPTDEHPGRIDT